MKKTIKFRKWLIRKLGGICIEDTPRVEAVEYASTVRVYGFVPVPKGTERYYPEKYLKKQLWQTIGEQIMPYVIIERKDAIYEDAVVYRASVTIVKGETK